MSNPTPNSVMSAAERLDGIMPLARKFGEMVGAGGEIPACPQISDHQFRFRRKDLWPPEVWAEMESIRKGEIA